MASARRLKGPLLSFSNQKCFSSEAASSHIPGHNVLTEAVYQAVHSKRLDVITEHAKSLSSLRRELSYFSSRFLKNGVDSEAFNLADHFYIARRISWFHFHLVKARSWRRTTRKG